MRLLATTHVPHWAVNGAVMSSGYFVRDLRIFGDFFDEVHICAPVLRDELADDAVAYPERYTLTDCPCPKGGSFLPRLRRLIALPCNVLRILRAMRRCDAVHIRCPGPLGLHGAIALVFSRKPRCAKYAGQWEGDLDQPIAGTIQRWLLSRRGFGGPVTVNALWNGNRGHIFSVFNSSVARAQLERARGIAQSKALENPTRFLFVGRIDSNKNLRVIVQAFARARAKTGRDLRLDVVGDGPERASARELVSELGLSGAVCFHGRMLPQDVWRVYADSHILVLASSAEGWPKTPMEAMCYGLPCICTNVSTLPMILADNERGLLVEPRDVDGLADAMRRLATDEELYTRLSRAGREWVESKTYEDLMVQIKRILEESWGMKLRTPDWMKNDA